MTSLRAACRVAEREPEDALDRREHPRAAHTPHRRGAQCVYGAIDRQERDADALYKHAGPAAALARVRRGRAPFRTRMPPDAGGRHRRTGSAAGRGAGARVVAQGRWQLRPAPRRAAAWRRRHPCPAGDGRAGRRPAVRRRRPGAVPPEHLRRPAAGFRANRLCIGRSRACCSTSSRLSGLIAQTPAATTWSAAGTAPLRHGCSDRESRHAAPRTGARHLSVGSGHPVPQRVPARDLRGAADSGRHPIGDVADRRDDRGRLGPRGIARGGSAVRRVLEIKPDFAEARLRFGRVLGLLGRHSEAVVELRRATANLTETDQVYFATLFLGAEEQALGNREVARAATSGRPTWRPRRNRRCWH